jgi:hypothetical protein
MGADTPDILGDICGCFALLSGLTDDASHVTGFASLS